MKTFKQYEQIKAIKNICFKTFVLIVIALLMFFLISTIIKKENALEQPKIIYRDAGHNKIFEGSNYIFK